MVSVFLLGPCLTHVPETHLLIWSPYPWSPDTVTELKTTFRERFWVKDAEHLRRSLHINSLQLLWPRQPSRCQCDPADCLLLPYSGWPDIIKARGPGSLPKSQSLRAGRGEAHKMALDVLAVAPLYEGPDINKIRLIAQTTKKSTTPPKALTPAKTKLTTIETKRIMSVLDETIHKVELVSLLSHAASESKTSEGMLGPDVTKAVREHEDLCQVLLDRVSYLQEEERKLQEAEEFEDEAWFRERLFAVDKQKSQLPHLMQEIKESTKNVVRLLLSNPQAASLLQAQTLGRSEEAQCFIDSLVELRGFLFEKLLTSPMEARDKIQFIQDITRRNRRHQEIIDTLENELAACVRNRNAEV